MDLCWWGLYTKKISFGFDSRTQIFIFIIWKIINSNKNGENIVFAIIDIEEAEKIIKSLQGIFEEFTLDFNNMRKIQNRILRKEIKQEFYKRVINKEDFLKESGL